MDAAGSPLWLARRTDSTRILLFGGVLLILLGMILGEVYAIFISHVAGAEIKQRLFTVVEAVGARDAGAVQGEFDTIESLLQQRGRIVNTHSHMTAFGFLALTLVVLQPLVRFSEQRRRWLAGAVIVGAFLQTVLVFTSFYVGRWAHFVSDLGAVLVIVGVAGNLVGLLRFDANRPSLSESIRPLLQSRPSRLLLRVGVLLILGGMIFGFYYAWVFVSQHEPQQGQFLEETLSRAMAGGVEAAQAAIERYRGVQSKIAILSAAHSHAIEFGMLAILLAFVQNFVFFAERWKMRWTWVFTTGAVLLPIFVYHATVIGLVSAAFADLSGLLVILALSAMVVGILRHTGAQDAGSTRTNG